MKDIINQTLKELDGYLVSITRNTETASYELTVGFESNWEYKDTNNVDYEELHKSDDGILLKIFGKHEDVIIDDLVGYVRKIILSNKKIAEMRENFDLMMEERKAQLLEDVTSFEGDVENVIDSILKETEEEPEPVSEEEVVTEDTETIQEENNVE